MRVLLVDDERMVLEGLAGVIDWASLNASIVGMAENGKEALRIARSNAPNVVITDVSMPVMDGLELARQIRETMEDVHVFLISGHDEFEYARQAIRYGVKSYILKPFNREMIHSLEEELRGIQKELNMRREHYLGIWADHPEEEMAEALKNADEVFFDSFFAEVAQRCRSLPEITVPACLKLLDLLYRYLRELNMRPEAVEKSQRNSMEEMLALYSQIDKLDFVFQKYYDVLNGVAQRKSLNSGSIAVSAQRIVDESFAGTDFNIANLADRLGCTPAYLSTVFRQNAGVNLNAYITGLRIELAKRLLGDLNRNIADVSQEVGYVDSHYFAKLFKKKTGLTPTEFRNLTVQSPALL